MVCPGNALQSPLLASFSKEASSVPTRGQGEMGSETLPTSHKERPLTVHSLAQAAECPGITESGHTQSHYCPPGWKPLPPHPRGAVCVWGGALLRAWVSPAHKRLQLSTINKSLNSEEFLTGAKRFPAQQADSSHRDSLVQPS